MPAASKEMRFWIDVSLECVRRDHTPQFGLGDQRGPFLTARSLGMALGALHDGYTITAKGCTLLTLPVPAHSQCLDPTVVGAAACHQLLLHRYPTQSLILNTAWDFWVRLFEISFPPMIASESYGRMIGDAVHLLGINDRQLALTMAYTPSGPYTHNVPPNQLNQTFAGSVWGQAARLITTREENFATPPGRKSATAVEPDEHFANDFKKVQTKGASDDRNRTGKEEVTGIFWGYDGPPELGTPPRLYMQVVLTVLDELESSKPDALSEQEELQIIAATGLAMADAGIDAWHYKYSPEHMMWRPILGIRAGLGALASAEPDWLPLGRPDTNLKGVGLTPDFPAYPSGHATFGAAAFQLLRTFLADKGLTTFAPNGLDNVSFCFVSDEFNGRNEDPRTDAPRPRLSLKYTNLWEAIIDNSLSRVFLGVHWQFDGVTMKGSDPDGELGVPQSPQDLGRRGGVWLGCQLANQVAEKIGVSACIIADSKAQ